MTDGEYKNCSIEIEDGAGNRSDPLVIETFIIDTSKPQLKMIAGITSPTRNNTPQVTFTSTKPGRLIYDGLCSSNHIEAQNDENTIVLNDIYAKTVNPLYVSEFCISV